MKNVFIALFIIAVTSEASAQKTQFLADAGICFAYNQPGLSVTYNYKATKHIGVGIGLQAYAFNATLTDQRNFIPALFADVHFNFHVKKKGQLFTFVDLGANFYQHNNDSSVRDKYIYTVDKNNGVYFGLGFGYFRQVTKRGAGLYVSLKLISNWCKTNRYYIPSGQASTSENVDATPVLSLGFRF